MTDAPAPDQPGQPEPQPGQPTPDQPPAEGEQQPAEASVPAKPAIAEWPEAPYEPASPQFPNQPGDRIKVRANVAIFDLQAGDESEVFNVPEVHSAANEGLVTILA